MSRSVAASYHERVLLNAPTRRDGEVTRKALASAGMACTACETLAGLAREMEDGVGALMLTDQALADPQSTVLLGALERQPSWSSVPIVLLCRDREQSPAALRGLERLRNVTLLDRPASLRSMISAVQASLRGRRWQYQIRDRMVAQLQAEEALREADQRKDEFLATLAHELRNPLAPIRNGLHALRRGASTAELQTRIFDMMERQLAQLVKLIDELLDVSRIATGKVVLQRQLVDMHAVVSQAIEGSQPAVEAGGHELHVNLPARAPRVVGDPSRLAQAVGNLINNAAKYTPDGGRIGVSLAQVRHEAVVRVTDSGVGIPPEMLSRVFELFAQVDRTLDRAQGGLGIGLSLVRSLVALHGGTVSAHSAGIDQGSAFEIRLPTVPGPALPAMCTAPPGPQEGSPQVPLRVLVIDDNADAADALALLLDLGGHETRVEYGAAAGLEAAREYLPEVIFCDLGMPGMGGHEFAAEIRRDPRFASTLLVAVTGWGGARDERRSRAAGFDHHLTKPAALEHIEAILARR